MAESRIIPIHAMGHIEILRSEKKSLCVENLECGAPTRITETKKGDDDNGVSLA